MKFPHFYDKMYVVLSVKWSHTVQYVAYLNLWLMYLVVSIMRASLREKTSFLSFSPAGLRKEKKNPVFKLKPTWKSGYK